MRHSNTADSDLLHPRCSLRGGKETKLLTLASPNQSQRDPRGSSSHHNFQSKGFLIYKRKLQMFIFTAGAFRPVMDNRWKLSRRSREAAMAAGWVKEKAGNRRPDVVRQLNRRIGCKYLVSPRLSCSKRSVPAVSRQRFMLTPPQFPPSHPTITGNVGMLEEAPKVETRDRMVVLRDVLKTKLKPGQGFQRFPVKTGFTCFKGASGV